MGILRNILIDLSPFLFYKVTNPVRLGHHSYDLILTLIIS